MAVILVIFLPMPVSLFSCLPLTFVFKDKCSMKLFRVEQGNQSIFQNYCLKGCWGNGNTHRETYSKMDTASCFDSEINVFLQTFINFVGILCACLWVLKKTFLKFFPSLVLLINLNWCLATRADKLNTAVSGMTTSA